MDKIGKEVAKGMRDDVYWAIKKKYPHRPVRRTMWQNIVPSICVDNFRVLFLEDALECDFIHIPYCEPNFIGQAVKLISEWAMADYEDGRTEA